MATGRRVRGFLSYSLYHVGSVVFLIALFLVFAWMVRPNMHREVPVHSEEELAAIEVLRDNSIDLENPPVVFRAVDYSEGPAASWYPQGESPIVRGLVGEGRLPPVAERVGPQPVVLEGPDGIGRYGGSWYRVANPGEITIDHTLSASTLVRWSPQGYPIVPHLARDWEVLDEGRVYRFYLREGMRWSDGHPFTTDDILYWWEDMQFINVTPGFMRIGNDVGTIHIIDAHTLEFRFPEPHGLFLERLAHVYYLAQPRHYLERFHPEKGDQDLIRARMQEMGLSSPRALYSRLFDKLNPEHPRLWPWVPRTYQRASPFVFIRNPYYWAVDPEGNQLPYIDRVVFDIKSPGMIRLSLASGEISKQSEQIAYEDYTLLMEQRGPNRYEVYHWFPGNRSTYTVYPNINRRVDPEDPATAHKHRLLNDVRFRRALSFALNRPQIIRAEYNGQGTPAQLSPGPQSPYHHEGLSSAATRFDPEEANRLLDELGLEERDREGYRTFPDGSRMYFFMHAADVTGVGPAQFLIDNWSDVGVRVILRYQNRALWHAEQRSESHDFSVWPGDTEFYPMVSPRNFVPVALNYYASSYGMWFLYGGFYGDARATQHRGLEPPLDHPLRRAMEIYDEVTRTADAALRKERFDEILDIAAENLWHISISTPPPALTIVQEGFRNVPRTAITGWMFLSPGNTGVETYFFDQPRDSAGAIAQIRRAMIEIEGDPLLQTAGPEERKSILGGLIRILVWGSCGAGLLLVGLKHPYIGRRLLIMVPTLLVISVITFAIIQLPPGDFLSSRIAYLQMEGNDAAIQEVRDLKTMFHYERPQWERYLRWMGVYWFYGFNSSDRGLLQGNLGRSMQNGDFVNDLVGDRILLTVLISAFTILFTWAFAIPVGIYSAVRQYSIADYVLTFLGFIGMCIPNFLLALLLMYFADVAFGLNVSGLFSAEYVTQPEWTWGKFVDLMQHIWVPVVVLGTAGTAGMIRVMRANLLDELRRPYVVTARAKGVRPMKLLFKYPVRLALNPFISSIGSIFPQLVSGGAIVAIVLSLPTVGPLMLTALLNQDMYLAGSMLMVLSLLGVFGTLVSDLLLLWLDPRIRLTGGTGR
jgi:ABC-type dipeptide/oligopeptide/nickel transport system permease component/ABC-type transport system substrate-binding protein